MTSSQSLARGGSLVLALSVGALLVARAAGCTGVGVTAPAGPTAPVNPTSTPAPTLVEPPRDAGPLAEDAGSPASALDANAPAFFPATKSAPPLFQRRPIVPAGEPVKDAPAQQAPR